jgi:hypothetical protein
MLTDFRTALVEWWRIAWERLLGYQRRFVNNNRRDDGLWPGEMGSELFRIYEWQIVRANVRESALLTARLGGAIRTAFGGTGSDSTDEVGRSFLDYAWQRIKSGRLLTGSADNAFDEVYSKIEAFVLTERLPYKAVTIIHNLRVGRSLALDDKTSIRSITSEERKDVPWRDTVWDDPWELPAAVETKFELKILTGTETEDLGTIQSRLRETTEDALMAIAVAMPQYGSPGKMVIGQDGWMPSHLHMAVQYDFPRGATRTRIQSEQEELVRLSWRAIHVRPDRRVRLGAERLCNLRRHDNVGSSLVEAVIALEAVIGDDAERELSHRISLLSARLVATDLDISERQVFDGLVEAFDFRTRILRGKVTSIDDARELLLLESTEKVVRRLLQMRVLSDSRLLTDSLEILLEGPNQHASAKGKVSPPSSI